MSAAPIDAEDRRLIQATQAGLPLAARPFEALANSLGTSQDEVMRRLSRLLALGVIRRIAAVPNHYKLGYRANGMSVWDVDDGRIDELGASVGALPFVSHCYRRPRRPPLWRYNLFAMVHGRSIVEVEGKIEAIAGLLGSASQAHEVLYSTRILKKTGLRLTE